MAAIKTFGERIADALLEDGLLTAQLALALNGKDRAEVLAQLVEPEIPDGA